MKFTITLSFLLISVFAFSQEQDANYVSKKVKFSNSIIIDSVSINSRSFSILKTNKTEIDTSYYSIDFAKSILNFKKQIEADSIIINYVRYPEFLTKTYRQLDDKLIVAENENFERLLKLSQSNITEKFKPFDGLNTSGSISRGVTVGNNQNSVLNSELDLQITGKLSEKVSLRASIQDANIPLQENGYSQRLDEFDQVFIELFSDNWLIRAGDIDLQNENSYFANFSKRVQGLNVNATLNHSDSKTNVFASGALVRGQYSRSQFTAQEGNQGPYKLQGQNGELFVLIVSGSELVYVNGIALKRGENEDYIIDYNAGQIIFNATFPITSEMRITVDYQFSERNYSRLIAYGGGNYESDKFKIGVSVYSENDSKNQPLQQNLSAEQIAILGAAGDDMSQMVAPSSTAEAFNENRILYKKELINGVEAFVFSNNADDDLFSVRFTLVGNNLGNYVLSTINAINNIFEYVEPIAGIPQGNYEPIVQLIAPEKLQIAVVNGSYKPTEKTNILFEASGSKNDLNLFSSLDDANNDGFAGKIKINQAIIKRDSLWNLNAFIDTDYIQENFRNIEGFYNPEFNRDWNLEQTTTTQIVTNFGNQTLLKAGLNLFNSNKGNASYQFEYLDFSENYNGKRHVLSANLTVNKFNIYSNSSYLTANSNTTNSTFFRSFNRATYSLDKKWIGAKISIENNEQTTIATNEFTALSQKFKAYEVFAGIGDSSNVFVEIGYKNRVNDSLRLNKIEKVNTSNSFYLKSKLIQNTTTNLSVFVNYRTLNYTDDTLENEKSINSRLLFNKQLFDRIVIFNTVYETNSGSLPQQDFTYVEVEPGQGTYTWNDYNNNTIQELEEFEIAQFQDQGLYIRVLLPNQVFVQTHQNRFSPSLTINFQKWIKNENATKKFFSHFYNQTSYLIDRKVERSGNDFDLNPFKTSGDNQLALNLNFRNVLFFNRGKQNYTTSYTYLTNKSQNLLSIGTISNKIKSHQLNFNHKFAASWLATFDGNLSNNESTSENFTSKNFDIDELNFNPKISYLLNDNTRFDVFYKYTNKENSLGDLETLDQQKYGASFAFTKNQKAAITGEFNYFSNDFSGLPNTPVAYQMLEGLQPGKNYTWSFLAQKKLTKFLDLNLNYFGRKSETSKTIHTGTIQLKAYF